MLQLPTSDESPSRSPFSCRSAERYPIEYQSNDQDRLLRNAAQVHTLGGLSAHGDQADLLRWYDSFTPRPPVFIVHGEVPSGEALATELRARGATATVTRPGLKIDLASLPVLARDSSAP